MKKPFLGVAAILTILLAGSGTAYAKGGLWVHVNKLNCQAKYITGNGTPKATLQVIHNNTIYAKGNVSKNGYYKIKVKHRMTVKFKYTMKATLKGQSKQLFLFVNPVKKTLATNREQKPTSVPAQTGNVGQQESGSNQSSSNHGPSNSNENDAKQASSGSTSVSDASGSQVTSSVLSSSTTTAQTTLKNSLEAQLKNLQEQTNAVATQINAIYRQMNPIDKQINDLDHEIQLMDHLYEFAIMDINSAQNRIDNKRAINDSNYFNLIVDNGKTQYQVDEETINTNQTQVIDPVNILKAQGYTIQSLEVRREQSRSTLTPFDSQLKVLNDKRD
ncbi:MAG: hypothetical protein LKJ64_03855 [Lentilactobacillus buchneri]|jgi:hypothetical protein|nr:hypothetical protein [Lentilactobacillus buchneri]MCI2019706.1 hypothetical protein [Lentilactobacillus buchneri]MCI2028118.1 hypothetical protein [Lentilactobacillus buchneri]